MAQGLNNASVKELQNVYIGLTALTRDLTVEEIREEELAKLKGLDNETLAFLIDNKTKSFDANIDQYVLNKESDLNPVSPKDAFITKAKVANNSDSFILHAMLINNGYEAKFDGIISDQDTKNLTALVEKYEQNETTFTNRVNVSQDYAVAAARQAEIEAVQQAAELTRTQSIEYINTGLALNGYAPEQFSGQFTTDNFLTFQHHSEEIFDGKSLNIRGIDEEITGNTPTDLANGVKLIEWNLAQQDFREDVVTWAEEAANGNTSNLSKLQTVVNAPLTGEYDLTTAQATLDYIETPKGLGKTNLAWEGDISATNLETNLNKGVIPVVAEALPPKLMALPDSLRNEHIALHLSDEANYKAYDKYLKTKYSADLKAEHAASIKAGVDKLEAVEATRSNPNALQEGADIAMAAINAGIELSEDGTLTEVESLQVLSNNILDYSDRFLVMSPDAGIDSTSISFSQMIEHEFMATQWFDQIYGSEYTVGDRTIIDAVLENGMSLEEASAQVGFDPNTPLDLENPQDLANFTEATFLMTHGKQFPDGSPYSKEQFLSSAYEALGEEMPANQPPENINQNEPPVDIPSTSVKTTGLIKNFTNAHDYVEQVAKLGDPDAEAKVASPTPNTPALA